MYKVIFNTTHNTNKIDKRNVIFKIESRRNIQQPPSQIWQSAHFLTGPDRLNVPLACTRRYSQVYDSDLAAPDGSTTCNSVHAGRLGRNKGLSCVALRCACLDLRSQRLSLTARVARV